MNIEWKPLVKTIAPWIGTALGGPLGGMAASAIGTAMGVDKPTESALGKLFSGMTEDQMAVLKKAEQDFQATLQQAGFAHIEQLEALAEKDRESARSREIQTRDYTPRLLAAGITIGFFGILAFMLLSVVPAQNAAILNIMLGSLGASWVGVVTYYFGSSAGSARKTELLKGNGSD